MSVDKWAYDPEICEDNYCCGDCEYCDIQKNPELYSPDLLDDEDEKEIEQEILAARRGEE